MPTKEIRPTVSLQGRARGNMIPWASALNIGTKGELYQYIAMAHLLGSWAAYSNMCAYVQEAHLLPKEAWSLMQNTALVKWKTPNWVPAEVRPLTRQSDPNTPVRINTPWTTDPPEEWARWLWRYPREAVTCPGILRAWYGINLLLIRGLLMVTVRALCGVTVRVGVGVLRTSYEQI